MDAVSGLTFFFSFFAATGLLVFKNDQKPGQIATAVCLISGFFLFLFNSNEPFPYRFILSLAFPFGVAIVLSVINGMVWISRNSERGKQSFGMAAILLVPLFILALISGMLQPKTDATTSTTQVASDSTEAPMRPIMERTEAPATSEPTEKPKLKSNATETAREERVKVNSLIDRAESLYERASTFPGRVTSSSGILDETYYADERRFQDLSQHDKPIPEYVDAKARAADMVIIGADPFLFSVAQDAFASCNAHDSALNLKVARAIIDEAKRTLIRGSNENWSPPDITDEVNGKSLCE